MAQLESQLVHHGNCIKAFTNIESEEDGLTCDKILEGVPSLPLYSLEQTSENCTLVQSLSQLFRSIIHIDWLTRSLASSIKAADQRGSELGSAILSARDREWKKEITSPAFERLVNNLSALYRSSIWEVCRIRTEVGFDERDIANRGGKASDMPLLYKLRIVCQEGAIVRNGIDIDRCDNVGALEMGEVVTAYGAYEFRLHFKIFLRVNYSNNTPSHHVFFHNGRSLYQFQWNSALSNQQGMGIRTDAWPWTTREHY